MKRCPTCNRTYPDTQQFCNEDGTRLEPESEREFDPMATMMASTPPPPPQSPPPPAQQDWPQAPPAGAWQTPDYQPPQPAMAPPSIMAPSVASPQNVYGAEPSGQAGKFMPAIVGGLIMGFLTSIPVVGSAFCCWAWAIAGGAVAGLMYIKKSSAQVQMADGAMVGGIAGAIGGLINIVIGLPLAYLVYGGNMHSNLGSTELGAAGYLLMAGVGGFIGLVIFGALGGLLSVPIFEKRKAGMSSVPPPPPQNFGGYR